MTRAPRVPWRIALSILIVSIPMMLLPSPAKAQWEIGAALTGGVRPETGGAGGYGALSFGYRLAVGVDILARVGLGAFARETELVIPIEVEARHRFAPMANDRLRLFVSGSFLHQHEVPWSSMKEHPVTGVAGTCDCIHHRTGLMASGGVLFKPFARLPLEAGARLSFAALLPHMAGPTFYATSGLSLEWTFE